MIALAFFAGIFLTAAVAILIVRGAKAPSQPPKPQRDLLVEMFDELTAKGARADDRMRSLSVRTPEREHCINCGLSVDPWCCCTRGRDLASKIEANVTPERDADFWDIANHEPEASRVEYRFLGVTGEEEA